MRTSDECLAKASEMEDRAARSTVPEERAEFLGIARSWRGVARRAAVQDAMDATLPTSGN